MIKKLFVIGCAFLMISCGGGKPGGVLEEEDMQKLLWDIARGGAYINNYVTPKYPVLSAPAISNKMLNEILQVHKITKKEFDKSMEYYLSHPDRLRIIVDSVNAQQQRLKTQDDNLRFKQDSIKRAADTLRMKADPVKFRKDSTFRADSIRKAIRIDSIKLKHRTDSLKRAQRTDSLRAAKILRKNTLRNKRKPLTPKQPV